MDDDGGAMRHLREGVRHLELAAVHCNDAEEKRAIRAQIDALCALRRPPIAAAEVAAEVAALRAEIAEALRAEIAELRAAIEELVSPRRENADAID